MNLYSPYLVDIEMKFYNLAALMRVQKIALITISFLWNHDSLSGSMCHKMDNKSLSNVL